MQFDAPQFALCLILLPVLAALLVRARRQNAQGVEAFTDRRLAARLRLQENRGRRWAGTLCVFGAFAALTVALMQPRWGEAGDAQRRGRDIMVLLDVSQSMLARDALPNRLAAAKAAVTGLVDAVELDGRHRIGLVAFSGGVTLLSPLTLDYAFFRDRLELATPQAVHRHGTMVGNAIRKGLHDFGGLASEYTDIVLISDGEDHGSEPVEAAKVAGNLGVSIHAIGIGDNEHGSPIPVNDGNAEQPYLMYGDETVHSRVHTSVLAALSRVSNGTFLESGKRAPDLGSLYRRQIADKSVRHLGTATTEGLQPRFQWFLALAVILLAAEYLLSGRHPIRTRGAGAAPATLLLAGAMVLASITGFRFASTPETLVDDGNRLYSRGDYDGALEQYERAAELLPDSPWIRFNLGSAHFKKYEYAEALQEYARALGTNEESLESRLAYNAGTVKYHQAVTAMVRFQDAVTPLREAIDLLRKSLELDPKQPDARFNLELALKLARELDRQRTTGVQDAQAANRTTSSGQGQVGDGQAQDASTGGRDLGSDPKDSSEPPRLAPSGESRDEGTAHSDQGATPRALTPEEAQKLVEIMRARVQAVQAQRQQWRQARMRDSGAVRRW